MPPRIAVMASGSGTTAEAFIEAGQRGDIKTQVGLVIVSRKNAGIFERINNLNSKYGLNIKTVLINSYTHPATGVEVAQAGRQTEAEQQAILDVLQAGNYDLVANMGYMKLIGPKIVEVYGWVDSYKSIYQARMVNTHPGLLPATKAMFGRNTQAFTLEHNLPYGGQTLHVVGFGYDDGPIIAEHKVAVVPGDTPDSLFERVQIVEKKYVPTDIEEFINARRAYLGG